MPIRPAMPKTSDPLIGSFDDELQRFHLALIGWSLMISSGTEPNDVGNYLCHITHYTFRPRLVLTEDWSVENDEVSSGGTSFWAYGETPAIALRLATDKALLGNPILKPQAV